MKKSRNTFYYSDSNNVKCYSSTNCRERLKVIQAGVTVNLITFMVLLSVFSSAPSVSSVCLCVSCCLCLFPVILCSVALLPFLCCCCIIMWRFIGGCTVGICVVFCLPPVLSLCSHFHLTSVFCLSSVLCHQFSPSCCLFSSLPLCLTVSSLHSLTSSL